MKLLVVLAAFLTVQSAFSASLKTQKAKISYAIGQQIGRQMKSEGVDIDTKVLGESISDVLKGKKSKMSAKEMTETMLAFRKQMQEHKSKMASANKAKGDKFLAKNKKKKGVKVTSTGLEYKVLRKGKGKKPKATSKVTVNYKGTLLDGSTFDSSYDRGKPATFALNQVIPGWTEGLQLMSKGAKYEFFIPAKLAYGPAGRPGIPPNSTLIFDVELIDVE